MKVVFCTNIWNHHQGPVCTELHKLLGGDFTLLLHQPLDHPCSIDRIRMGWNLHPPAGEWIVGPPKRCCDVDYAEYVRIAMSADVLIMDALPPYLNYEMLALRNHRHGLNFVMSERWFKKKKTWLDYINPRKIVGRMIVHHRMESANIYYLTQGHWVASDLAYYGVCRNRIFRWGYLTAVSPAFCERSKRGCVHVGWCGRFIGWKRVDMIVRAISLLPEDVKSRVRVALVGEGVEEPKIRHMAHDLGLDSLFEFHSPMSTVEIADFMRDLDIYVFPSNREEGWGAALLEAMDKGCAVIANAAAGSTLEVVKDGENGFVFDDNDEVRLSQCINTLVCNDMLRQAFGRAAWMSMQEWSPYRGALNLVSLIGAIQSGKEPHGSGLCGKVA